MACPAGHAGASDLFFRFARSTFFEVRVHVAAVIVQIIYAGFQILACTAVANGSSGTTIFLFYRNAIAASFLASFSFFLERRIRPALTLHKLMQFFLCGLMGVCINQVLFLAGLSYTSATFTATMQNLTPALTFALAALLRIERISIKSREGQAKVLGMTAAVAGAMLIALCKDRSVLTGQGLRFRALESTNGSWQWGSVCLLGNCLTWAIWFILQNPVMKDYPAHLSATVFIYTFGSIQLVSLALFSERDPQKWISTLWTDFPAIIYGGLLTSGVAMTLQAWCACKGGPILVAAYQPLQTILVAILSSVCLGETVSLCSFIGGSVIVVGLYLVLWGKSREGRVYCSDDQSTLTINRDVERLTEPLLSMKEYGIFPFQRC